jgi:hypothetical protein
MLHDPDFVLLRKIPVKINKALLSLFGATITSISAMAQPYPQGQEVTNKENGKGIGVYMPWAANVYCPQGFLAVRKKETASAMLPDRNIAGVDLSVMNIQGNPIAELSGNITTLTGTTSQTKLPVTRIPEFPIPSSTSGCFQAYTHNALRVFVPDSMLSKVIVPVVEQVTPN